VADRRLVDAEEREVSHTMFVVVCLVAIGYFLLGVGFGKMIGRRQVYEEWVASLERERLERLARSQEGPARA